MKRDEIIERIESVRIKGVNQSRSEEIKAALRSAKQRRSKLADDFHRAIVYCFILFTRVGYLNKERRNFLRPTKRALLMTAGLFAVVIVQVFVLALVLAALGLRDSILLIVLFVLLFELGYVVSKGNKLIRVGLGDEFGLSQECVKCRYDLDGHDSVLGDTLWVGPEVCPECGHRYPAIV